MITKPLLVLSTCFFLTLMAGCTVHQSVGDNIGSYISAPDGQAFKPVGYRWDYDNTALLYVYRPATEWSMDELGTPSFNVNGKRLFNLKGGGYTWYELHQGEYEIVIRRGLFGMEGVNAFEIKRHAPLFLNVQAGQMYFLRYSEIDPPRISPGLTVNPLGDGPLQLVDSELALSELAETRQLQKGRALLTPIDWQDETQLADKGVSPRSDGDAIDDTRTRARAEPRKSDENWWPF